MLAEVDKNWELYVPAAESAIPATPLSDPSLSAPDIRDKLAGIILENIDLEALTLQEALDYVRVQSRLGDVPDAAGEQSGVNILLNIGDSTSDAAKSIASRPVSIVAKGLPLTKVLDYITDQTRTQWRTDGVSVIITPQGMENGGLISRSFRVPPHFLQSASVQNQDGNDDPFGESDEQEGKLPSRISITDFLKQSGVSFPDGASATYTASDNTLIVRNTPGNIDLIDQLVSLIASEEPVMVMIRTAIIRVTEEKIKELGFDWAITPLALKGGISLGGGTVGSGTSLSPLTGDPITSGNRSGNRATAADPFNLFLNAGQSNVVTNASFRSPGILNVTAVTNGMVIQGLMRGLNQATGADILVKPSTISRSGELSKVEVVREFIYPTEYEPPEIPTGGSAGGGNSDTDGGGGGGVFPVTPATPTAFETRDVGITLEVLPTVGPDKKYIDLSINPNLVEFDGFVNYGSPIVGYATDALGNPVSIPITNNAILLPVFKRIRTRDAGLTIQDGATVVLGGLVTSKRTKIEDKTPILGDIPIAGRLFRSEASRTFREAIIITVTAEIVDPTGRPWRKR